MHKCRRLNQAGDVCDPWNEDQCRDNSNLFDKDNDNNVKMVDLRKGAGKM